MLSNQFVDLESLETAAFGYNHFGGPVSIQSECFCRYFVYLYN